MASKKKQRADLFKSIGVEQMCDWIAEPKSLRQIADELSTDELTVWPANILNWFHDDDERSKHYARAMELRALKLADEIIEIADDVTGDMRVDKDGNETVDYEAIQRSKLRVDTRKWVASKLLPKVYGDKQQIDHTSDGKPISVNINLGGKG